MVFMVWDMVWIFNGGLIVDDGVGLEDTSRGRMLLVGNGRCLDCCGYSPPQGTMVLLFSLHIGRRLVVVGTAL